MIFCFLCSQVIDSYLSTKAGMFHYVVELYDSEGTRLARRLPRKSGIVEHVTKDDQVGSCADDVVMM